MSKASTTRRFPTTPATAWRIRFRHAALWVAAVVPCCQARQSCAMETATAVIPAGDARHAEEFFEKEVRPLLARHCFECHDGSEDGRSGGLSLASRDDWLAGGDSGPAIVPGDADASLFIKAIEYGEAGYEMPPTGKLDDKAVATLRHWVAMGAFDPRRRSADSAAPVRRGIDIEAGRAFWAFRPVAQPAVPPVVDTEWPRTDADRFVLSRLEAAGLTPADDSQPQRLIRRISYDLTGLPPTPEEVQAFVDDVASSGHDAAIARVADRLLDTRQYAEKWGRHWLDVARYADSNGASFNTPFPQAWRYRNWVIDAFERDMPIDRFLAVQLAGDLMEADDQATRDEQVIATGFLMFGSKVLGQFEKEQLLLDVVDEQLDTLGKAMLGMTLGCARCHDHKFDPIPQTDYYALAGILASTTTLQDRFGGPKEDESDWSRRGLGPDGDERLRQFLATHRYEWIKVQQKAKQAEREVRQLEQALAELPSGDKREQKEKALAEKRLERGSRLERLAEIEAHLPPYAEAVADAEQPADLALRIRGVASAHGPLVPRGFLQVASFPGQPAVDRQRSGRLQLASWVTSPDNPLTSRVFVNRVWQKLFGEGLVRSVDNFGTRGDPPTHPELLDDLSHRFMEAGWRLKPLIRELVTSRAYRMGTIYRPDAAAADPENRLLWRQNKRRLEPEELRDTILAITDRLDLRPAQNLASHLAPKDINDKDVDDLSFDDVHRTIYQPVIRTMELDVLQIFDFANPGMTTGRRPVTNVPTQALYFLNAPFVADAADRLGRRVLPSVRGTDVEPVVRHAFRTATCREPSPAEAALLAAYLATQFEGPPGPTQHDLAKLCQAIIGSTQFQILD